MLLKQLSDSEISEYLGERIKTYRKEAKISQKRLANDTGLSTSTIQKFETGKMNISVLNLFAIMRTLGLIENVSLLFPEQPHNPYK